MARKKAQYVRSRAVEDGNAKRPTVDQIDYGEIAVNYADGAETLFIRNSGDNIVALSAEDGDKYGTLSSDLSKHIADYDNPHEVTKEQVGLGNVDNTADTDKPVSTALQEALDLKLTQNLYNSFERTEGIDDYTVYQWTAQSALVLYQTIESQLDFSSTEEDLEKRISALEAVLAE